MQPHVYLLNNVSRLLGLQVWIVREDLYALHGIGGSKARKLERILESARLRSSTDLVTVGTTGSHHIHAASIMGSARNLTVHAILLPQPELPYAKYIHEQTRDINKNLTYVQNAWQAAVTMHRVYRNLQRSGRRPYFILPGGSNPDGVAAYADAACSIHRRIAEDSKMSGTIDYQVCVLGTGGITAGLVSAARLQKLPAIHAVQVYPGFWNNTLYIQSMAWLSRFKSRRAQRAKDVDSDANRERRKYDVTLNIDGNFLGDGYGTLNPLCEEAVSMFEQDNIFLDPIYMARAGQSLIHLARSRIKPRGLLFWYTAPGIRP
ncbi:MAG: pyridoxal-phosphate dependent enzyme [Leptospirales bacterium]|nr:pyridoxal-phosphate dependent enzyme [Leptospirales bacterium]